MSGNNGIFFIYKKLEVLLHWNMIQIYA